MNTMRCALRFVRRMGMRQIEIRHLVRVFIICTVWILVFSAPLSAAEKIVLIGSHDTKNSLHGRWLTLIYTEVFTRLGYEFEYIGEHSYLASRISDAGRVDGEINRVSLYQNSHPDMIRVEESHFPTILAAYAVAPGMRLNGWESLIGQSQRVEYRRGTKIAELGLTPVIPKNKLSKIYTTDQGLKRLITGRTDIYIDVEDIVTETIMRLNPEAFDPSRVYQAGIMARDTLHLYLHKKNAALVPKVDKALKALKKEGLIQDYKQRAMVQK